MINSFLPSQFSNKILIGISFTTLFKAKNITAKSSIFPIKGIFLGIKSDGTATYAIDADIIILVFNDTLSSFNSLYINANISGIIKI